MVENLMCVMLKPRSKYLSNTQSKSSWLKNSTWLQKGESWCANHSKISDKCGWSPCFCTAESLKKSLRRRSQELGISVTSLQRMLRKDLTKFPYKISTCHELTADKQRCTEMCNRIAERMNRFQNWINKVWFTDEAHFHLNGAVNHHNNVYWEDRDLKRSMKGAGKTQSLWLNAKKGVLGPYWFEDSRGRTVTVNGELYRKVLNRWIVLMRPQPTIHTKPKVTMVPARWCNSPYSTRDYGPFAHIAWKQNLEFAGRARMVST